LVVQAQNSNRSARMAVQRIVTDQPRGEALYVLLARAAGSIAETSDALSELESLGLNATRPLPEGEAGGS
jgi:hypothetical protein